MCVGVIRDLDPTSGQAATTTCKDTETYCIANPQVCGTDRNAVGAHFSSLGCCTQPGSDPGKRCAGGSTRQCENVEANGLTFQCSMIGTQSADSIDVLLLHGFPEYNKYWDPLLEHWESSSSNIHAVY